MSPGNCQSTRSNYCGYYFWVHSQPSVSTGSWLFYYISFMDNSDLDKILEILRKHFKEVEFISDKGGGLYEIKTGTESSFLSGNSTTATYRLEEGKVKTVEVISVSMS